MKYNFRILVLIFLSLTINSTFTNAQWQQTNGPFAGTINCLSTKGDTVYAGTNGGAFYSKDYGDNWVKLSTGFEDSNVISIASNGTDVFAGVYTKRTIYISNNDGISWLNNNFGSYPIVLSIAISDSSIYAGTYGIGIYLSTDRGKNWKQISSGMPTNLNGVNTILVKGKNVYAGTDSGVYISNNNGASWQKSKNIIGFSIKSLIIKDNNVFAGTKGGGVFMSSDTCKTWIAVNTGLAGNVSSLAVSGTNIYAGTDYGVYISADNGGLWKLVNNGNTLFSEILSLTATGNYVFAGTRYGGVFKTSDNGLHWIPVNNKFYCHTIYTMVANDSDIFAGTKYGGVYIYKKGNNNWKSINNGLTINAVNNYQPLYGLGVSGSKVFASNGLHMFLSTDYGSNWFWKKNELNNYSCFTLKIIGSYILVGANNGIYLSSDTGATWSQTGKMLGTIYSIVQCGTGIFAGGKTVYYSADSGKTWQSRSSGIKKLYSYYFEDAIKLTVSGKNIYAGTNRGVYLSEDNGANWIDITNGLKDTMILSIAVADTNIFVSTWSGVLLSSDKGKSWNYINDGLNDTIVYSMLIFDKNIYAGTKTGGILKRSISQTISIKRKLNNNSFSIYPNPVNDKLIIETTNYINAKAEIINLNGSILTNVNLFAPKTTLNVSNLKTGLFFIKIISDKTINTRKFIKN